MLERDDGSGQTTIEVPARHGKMKEPEERMEKETNDTEKLEAEEEPNSDIPSISGGQHNTPHDGLCPLRSHRLELVISFKYNIHTLLDT